MEQNKHALANAYKVAAAKTNKIKELGITSKMTKKDTNVLVELLARNKADDEGKTSDEAWLEFTKGQRWYVEDLQAFSVLTPKEKLDLEYGRAFGDVASEDEMLESLEALAA